MEVKTEKNLNHFFLKEREKKPKVNLILSHHAFLILDTQIGPQTFRHTHCTLIKKVFKNVKKGLIHGSICFKLVPGLLVLGPLSKMALRVH
jgi:hypothetical protein